MWAALIGVSVVRAENQRIWLTCADAGWVGIGLQVFDVVGVDPLRDAVGSTEHDERHG